MLKVFRVMFEFWQWQFCRMGRFVGHRPIAVLVTSLVLVALCCLGFLKASFMDNVDSLWVGHNSVPFAFPCDECLAHTRTACRVAQVPPNSKAMVDQAKFSEYFPTDPFSRLESIVIIPKNRSADMLSTKLLNQVRSRRGPRFGGAP